MTSAARIHSVAVAMDKHLRYIASALPQVCTFGLHLWCLGAVADESPLHSPSNEPRGKVGHSASSPTEAAALGDEQAAIALARRYLDAYARGDTTAMVNAATSIRRLVDPEALVDPCKRCGRRVTLRSQIGGQCKSCERVQ